MDAVKTCITYLCNTNITSVQVVRLFKPSALLLSLRNRTRSIDHVSHEYDCILVQLMSKGFCRIRYPVIHVGQGGGGSRVRVASFC